MRSLSAHRVLVVAFLLAGSLARDEVIAADIVAVSIGDCEESLCAELQFQSGATWVLRLEPRSHRASGFSVLLDIEGTLVPLDAPPVATYFGSVEGISGSQVAGGLLGGRWRTLIQLPGETWHLEPLPEGDLYALYRHDDPALAPTVTSTCGDSGPAIPPPTSLLGPGGVAEVSYDVDHDLYTEVYSQDPGLTVSSIEIEHAQVQVAFDALGIVQEVGTIIIRTTPGQPYTPHDALNPLPLCGLLAEVDAQWSQVGSPLLETHGVQLLTYRDGSGGLVVGCGSSEIARGISHSSATGGEICGPFPTAISLHFPALTSWRLVGMAHEWGHLWGAGDCCSAVAPCGIMCGDSPPGPLCDPNPCFAVHQALFGFDPGAEAAIVGFAAGASCLAAISPVLPPPLNEQFPVIAGSLQPPIWTFVVGAQVLQPSPLPPTPLHALSLTNGAYPATDLRTGRINLSGAGNWHVSLRVKPNGLAPGEVLTVQYLRADSSWHPLSVIVSDFLDPALYSYVQAQVPDDARFAEFRVRFFIPEHGAAGSWLIDDFRIRHLPFSFVRGDATGEGTVNLSDPIAILGELFQGQAMGYPCLASRDVFGDGSVDVADPIALLAYLFLSGPSPVAPFPDCGALPAGEVLECETFSCP